MRLHYLDDQHKELVNNDFCVALILVSSFTMADLWAYFSLNIPDVWTKVLSYGYFSY